jgi:hypothetical protein
MSGGAGMNWFSPLRRIDPSHQWITEILGVELNLFGEEHRCASNRRASLGEMQR